MGCALIKFLILVEKAASLWFEKYLILFSFWAGITQVYTKKNIKQEKD